MKYAYYEFVSNEEEKQSRLKQIRESSCKDPAYYSAYLEIAPRYDAPIRELKALKALKAAIRKGKIQTVVISSIENFYMEEAHTLNLLLSFMGNGIQIAFGTPSNIQSEDDIYAKYFDAQMECIITVLSIPMITMKDCRIYCLRDTPFIRLLEDCTEEDLCRYEAKMLYADAVKQYRATGFFFYRSDVKSWYHIRNYIAEQMIESYNLCYKTLFESIDFDAPDIFL